MEVLIYDLELSRLPPLIQHVAFFFTVDPLSLDVLTCHPTLPATIFVTFPVVFV